jgi:Protein of unknown function (DUF2568)
MGILKSSNLALRFLVELGALAAVAYWGVHTGQGLAPKLALGTGAPLLLAVVWGTFAAPKAAVQLPQPAKFVLGLVILEVAALMLALAGQRPLALAYAVVVALNAGLLLAWQQ